VFSWPAEQEARGGANFWLDSGEISAALNSEVLCSQRHKEILPPSVQRVGCTQWATVSDSGASGSAARGPGSGSGSKVTILVGRNVEVGDSQTANNLQEKRRDGTKKLR
jgi:hypothetical protein